MTEDVQATLEYLRGEIRAERISQGELIYLQSLAQYIEPGDVELLEWAGVPEGGPRCDVCGEIADLIPESDEVRCYTHRTKS